MMTVHEVSRLTGVSVRTLHYYDEIGLLSPASVTGAGYRLYDRAGLERLQQILFFRELEFPLKEIRSILDSPAFDRVRALEDHIRLLELKKERLEQIIAYAKKLKAKGVNAMDFTAFDKKKLADYAEEAKRRWGDTDAYKESARRTAGYSEEKLRDLAAETMDIFAGFGRLRGADPADPAVQAQVQKLQDFITANFYRCEKPMLAGLGALYTAGGELTDNIDAAGGPGTAVFAAKAIAVYCKS